MNEKKNYKWIVFVISFLMVFVCLGFCSGNKALYLGAITEALQIPRSLFSINDSCRYIATAVMNLFFGTLVSKYGTRNMIAFGFVTLIASHVIYATADNILLFYLGGTLLGVGLSFTTTTMASSVLRRWFTKDIGTYTGIVFAANGVGGALAAQIISPIIYEEGNPFGYRKSYFLVAGILVVVGVLAVVLMREKPNESTEMKQTTEKKKTRGCVWEGLTYERIKKKPYFYLVAVLILVTGFSLQGISGIYAAHMRDEGLSATTIARVASVSSLALTGSKILVGILYDKIGLRKAVALCECMAVLAFLTLAFLSGNGYGVWLTLAFALLYAIALPLETLMIPLIVNDMFGKVSYDKILGVMCAFNYAGYALGAPLLNICYDVYGSYRPILFLLGIVMIPVIILFQVCINLANKEKEKEGKEDV